MHEVHEGGSKGNYDSASFPWCMGSNYPPLLTINIAYVILIAILSSCFLPWDTAGKNTTDEELEEMLESGNPSIFTSGVSRCEVGFLFWGVGGLNPERNRTQGQEMPRENRMLSIDR